MSAHATTDKSSSHDEHHGLSHVMPVRMLFIIFGILLALTFLTVFLAEMHLGSWEIIITMTIATIKATLVAVYFMHLRYDRPINAIFFLFSFFFVALFVGFTILDSKEYQPELLLPPDEKGIGKPLTKAEAPVDPAAGAEAHGEEEHEQTEMH